MAVSQCKTANRVSALMQCALNSRLEAYSQCRQGQLARSGRSRCCPDLQFQVLQGPLTAWGLEVWATPGAQP